VYWHDGRAWDRGRPGNEYQVTLRSRQSQDVLAVISVDGVNVVTGQTADPSQSGYVLAPARRARHPRLAQETCRRPRRSTSPRCRLVCGAHRATGQRRRDRRGAVPPQGRADTAAAGLTGRSRHRPRSAGIRGTRRVAAPGRWKTGSARDTVGRRIRRRSTSPSSERPSSPAEVVTLYYDSHANLLARGIIREPIPVAPLQPRPFPASCPTRRKLMRKWRPPTRNSLLAYRDGGRRGLRDPLCAPPRCALPFRASIAEESRRRRGAFPGGLDPRHRGARALRAQRQGFSTWLYTIAHNLLVDHWRKKGLSLVFTGNRRRCRGKREPRETARRA